MLEFLRKHFLIHIRKPMSILRKNCIIDIIMLYLETYLLEHKKMMCYCIDNVKKYCEEYHQKYTIIEPACKREVCTGAYFGMSKEQITEEEAPDIYIAELQDMTVVGQCGVLIGHGKALLDILCRSDAERFDYATPPIARIRHNRMYIGYYENDMHVPEAICLVGFAPDNYYHVTIEILSRLAYIDQNPVLRQIPVLVDQALLETKQFRQLLDMVNIYQHKIIAVPKQTICKIDKLYYASLNAWFPINQKIPNDYEAGDFVIAKSCVKNIRDAVLNQMSAMETDKRVFISRKNTSRMRLQNEETVRKIFCEYGFSVIYPEEMTLEEQIMTFHQAEYVAGATGAALTNSIYVGENTTIICIDPKKHAFEVFAQLTYLAGAHFIYLEAEIIKSEKQPALDLYKCDEAYCRRFLEELVGRKKICR